MALLNTLATGATNAGKMGAAALKKMFGGMFDGDKKRIASSKKPAELKEGATELEAFAAAVKETNEILIESVDLQKDQNNILSKILDVIGNIKSGKNNKPEIPDLPDVPDVPEKKPKPKPRVKPRIPPGMGGALLSAAPLAATAAVAGIGAYGAYKAGQGISEYSDIPNREDKNVLDASSTKPDGTPMSDAEMREQAFKQRGNRLGGRQPPTLKPTDKIASSTKETAAQIISFDARDITFTTKDMLIRTSEIKINGEVQQPAAGPSGATPSESPSATTPNVLGTQPTPPGASPSAATPGNYGEADKTGENGKLKDSQLASIGIGNHKAQPAAAEAFKAMRQAAANDKVNLGVSGAYRTYQRQVELKREKPTLAATPGKSNHGWGLAFDMDFGGNMNSPGFKWMQQKASQFGIQGPLQRPFEAWHWEYKGGGGIKSYASGTDYVPETGPAIVGEKGPELVMGKDGSSRMTGDGPHVEHLQKGDSVLPADKTKGYIEGENSFLNYNMATGEKLKNESLVNLRQRAHGQRISESVAEDKAGFGRMQFGADGTDYGAHNKNFYYDRDVMGEKVTATGYYNQITDKHYSPESGIKQNIRNRPEAIQGKLDRWNMNDNAKHYAEGTDKAENEIRKRGPNFPHVERSGSYMSRPRYFDSAEQMYVAMGDRPAGNITEKQDRESYEVIEALQRGEKPPKPDSMTQKEYMNRIKDYGAQAMLKGNLSPEELQKATRQADQPLWKSKAEDKAASFSQAAAMQQPQVKPLIPPPPPPEAKPSSRDDWAKDAQSSGMDWELESLDKGRQPEIAGASGMGTTSGDLLKAYLTSGQ